MSLLAICGLLSMLLVSGITVSANSTGLLTTKQIKKNLNSRLVTTHIKPQEKLTAQYQKVVKSSQYTLDSPYIKINPYKTSPLSALVIFKTPQAAKISYTVIGKTDNTSLTNQVHTSYTKTHQIPIVGLYANYTNTVKITVTYRNGKTASKTILLKTGSLPKYLSQSDIKVTKNNKSKMDIGDNKLTIINRTTKQPYAIDADGQIRWYSTNYSQHTFESLKNGHILIQTKHDNDKKVYNYLQETDYLGRVYREYKFNAKTATKDSMKAPLTLVHHDVTELPNGDLLATVTDGSKKYVEDSLVQISHKTGKVVKVIDFKKILPKEMYTKYKSTAKTKGKSDWLHINAVDYDKNDNSILVSSRNQDLILKLDYKTNKIKWIYSGKKKSSWPKKYRSKLLTRTKGTTITGGQHGLYLLNNGGHSGNNENIMLYDNNINVTNGDKKTSGKYSQAVEYQIDYQKMQIKQVWSYGKALGKKNFTNIIGYAQKLSNGNTLVDFGFKKNGNESNIIEVNSSGQQVFNVTLKTSSDNKTYAYRAYRMSVYPTNYKFDVND